MTIEMRLPEGWKEALLAEMDRRFEICRVAGRFDDDALCIDDTQMGVEFAIDQIQAMLEAAHTVDSSWIDQLVTRLPHVRPRFVEDVKLMHRSELQRRALIGSDWQGSFACSLDGIPEISCMPGSGIDGCRMPQEVRAIVTQLVEECPKTWAKTWTGKMKEAT